MTQKEKIMTALGVSADEAEAILQADEQIDKGFDLFPLDAEQKKVEKKMRQADRKKNTVYNFQPRERKKNEIKGNLISEIAGFLSDKVENLTIPNAERVIAFEKDGKRFEITLTQKRK